MYCVEDSSGKTHNVSDGIAVRCGSRATVIVEVRLFSRPASAEQVSTPAARTCQRVARTASPPVSSRRRLSMSHPRSSSARAAALHMGRSVRHVGRRAPCRVPACSRSGHLRCSMLHRLSA